MIPELFPQVHENMEARDRVGPKLPSRALPGLGQAFLTHLAGPEAGGEDREE